MKQPATIELFSFWDSLRARLDHVLLDAGPSKLRDLLGNTFLLEVDARRAYPLRVVGGTLTRLSSQARIGSSFLECWDIQSQDLLEAMLQAVHEERIPVVIGARVAGDASAPMGVECLLLPLAGGPGEKPRILGGVAPIGAPGRRAGRTTLEIVSARPMRSSPQARPIFRKLEEQTAPLMAPAPAPPPRPTFGHLRVIEGGRSNLD